MAGSATIWTPPVHDNGLAVSYKVEDDKLLKRTTQADRPLVLEQNKRERTSEQGRFMGGWKVASIPLIDVPRVKAKYPELFDHRADADLKKVALVKFSRDPDFAHLIIKRA